jgi:hypothetical protein
MNWLISCAVSCGGCCHKQEIPLPPADPNRAIFIVVDADPGAQDAVLAYFFYGEADVSRVTDRWQAFDEVQAGDRDAGDSGKQRPIQLLG